MMELKSYFQILKDGAVKNATFNKQNLETSSGPQDWKRRVFILIPKEKQC